MCSSVQQRAFSLCVVPVLSLQTQSNHLSEIQSLQERVGELEEDLAVCNSSLQKLREQLQIRDIHLQQKNYKVNELCRQVSGAGTITLYIQSSLLCKYSTAWPSYLSQRSAELPCSRSRVQNLPRTGYFHCELKCPPHFQVEWLLGRVKTLITALE